MQELLRNELMPNEKLIWSDTPQKGIMLKASDVFMIPFSLLWGGFAFFWEYSVLKNDAPIFMVLFGIPFVLVGLYIIIGRFFYDTKKREGSIYGLTETRAIIISGILGKKTTSLNLKSLPEIQVKARQDGTGTIVLGASNPMQFFQGSGWPGASNSTPAFEGIQNVQRVKQYIHQYQNT